MGNTISTRNLAALPDVDRLRAAMQSMALLDAILQPDWEYRLFSFNTRWSAGEQLGSTRNGQGDDLFALFNAHGCWIKGFAHESPMTPYRLKKKRVWAGVLDAVPRAFADCLSQRAFDVADTTFCVWWLRDDPDWRCGPVKFPKGHPDPDGSEFLLGPLDGRPETYLARASRYFSRGKALTLDAVRHVFEHRPIDDAFVRRLNPETSLAALQPDIDEIGYPNRAASQGVRTPTTFKLDHKADAGGTSLRGETKLPPAFLMKRFGKHDGGDGVRTSGGWTFAGETGEVFTVYEWRCTTLSNGRGSGSPTVREFWSSWEPVKFHIGGRPDTDWKAFRRWLQGEHRAFRKAQG